MVSIIVCSKNKELAKQLAENIEQTIGVPYELLVTDNTRENLPICTVYRKSIPNSRYPFLCFVHEDVLFRTENWGKNLLAHFSLPNIGLVGVAGSDAFSNIPSTWSNALHSVELNIIQHYKEAQKQPEHIQISSSKGNSPSSRVVALDGVFLAAKKEIFEKIQFDDTLLRGFHGYDIDISLQSALQYTNLVIFDILIEHLSPGSLNKDWMDTTLHLSRKWRKKLPVFLNEPAPPQKARYHWQTLFQLIRNLIQLDYSFPFVYKTALRFSLTRFFSIRRFLSLHMLLLNEYRNRNQDSTEKSKLNRENLLTI